MHCQENTYKLWQLTNHTASFQKKTVLEIQQISLTQSEVVCTESLTLLASRKVLCLQIHLSSKNTACKSAGQTISQLLWEILFSIFINIVPKSLGHRSGSLCARLRIPTKMKWSSIQKTYSLNIRQGGRCVQTIRQASGNADAVASWQRWGCPGYAMRMAQP